MVEGVEGKCEVWGGKVERESGEGAKRGRGRGMVVLEDVGMLKC